MRKRIVINISKRALMSRKREEVKIDIRDLVKIMFQAIFRRKSLSLSFRLSFQNAFQEVLVRGQGGWND